MTRGRLPIEAGQIWRARIRRKDGTREHVRVLSVNAREAEVQPIDPSPDAPHAGWSPPPPRRIGILVSECPGGGASVGNMCLVVLADGRPVSYPPGGPVVGERPAPADYDARARRRRHGGRR